MTEVYEQVIITCTIINVMMMIVSFAIIISYKISDYRAKKRKREEKKALEMKAE